MTDALSSGIDRDELDPAVRPQDDLYRHVNGRWIARTPIPDDKARYGSFLVLAEDAEKAVREIIEQAQQAELGTLEKKVGDLYASFMDEDRIEALGASPLSPLLGEVDAIADVDALLSTLGSLERRGVPGFVQLFVDNDPGDPERYLIFVEQGGLGLPDEAYYREEKHAETLAAYRAHVERMLALAGLDEAAARADRVVALETAIAGHHWNTVRNRDAQATYNLATFDEWATRAAGVDLERWRDGYGIPPLTLTEVVLRQPDVTDGIAAELTGRHLDEWLDWLRYGIVRSMAPYLSIAFVEESFAFFGRTLTGAPELRARWKRGVALVERAMGEAVGATYVERHFKPAAKIAMDDLVENLVEAYRQSIETLEWMTPATRERALEKLRKFTPKIGYPDKWRDYSTLEISADDLLANVQAAGEFEFQRELKKIGSPIDRDEWFMTPQTVNAYYNPGFNEIVFPAAILQYPFFDAERDAAANYGAIGAVIGHEIGHVVFRHANERMSRSTLVGAGVQAGGALVGMRTNPETARTVAGLLGAGAQLGVMLPFSREQEREVDVYGQDLMAKAGFDPAEASRLWQNMIAASGRSGGTLQALSTHPDPQARATALQQRAPALQAQYQAARAQGKRPSCG